MNEAKNITSNKLEELNNLKGLDHIRNVMWHKSIELFYGKDYRGNPETDNRMVPSLSRSMSKDISYGDVFRDAWEETDDFCKVASYEIIEFSNLDVKETISILEPSVILEWLSSSGIKVMPSDPSVFVVPVSIENSAADIAKRAVNFFAKRTIKINQDIRRLGNKLIDPGKEIQVIKTVIEKHPDFEEDWGLDSWAKYLPEMPGWGKVYKVDPYKIAYWYSWNLAETAFRFTETKFGASILKVIHEMIRSGKITADQINSATAPPTATVQPTVTTQPYTTPATSVAPSGPTVAAPAPKPAAPKPAAPRPAAPKPTAARKRPNYD